MTEQAASDRDAAATPGAMWISSVTISVPDVPRAVRFWARFLGWRVSADDPPRGSEPPGAGWAQLQAPDGSPGLRSINVEYERHYQPPEWPSRPGSQHITTHLDIPVDDLDGAVARAVAAGATVAEFQPQDDVRVMLDPGGHPFCLFR